MYRSLADAVLVHKRTDGSFVAPIEYYYSQLLAPLDSSYRAFIPSRANTRSGRSARGVCPYPDHEDSSPSFGILLGRNGHEHFNCFGCSRSGNVLQLHKDMASAYFGRVLRERDEIAVDLCTSLGIDVAFLSQFVTDELVVSSKDRDKINRELVAMSRIRSQRGVKGFSDALVSAVAQGQSRAVLNTLVYRAVWGMEQDAVQSASTGSGKLDV